MTKIDMNRPVEAVRKSDGKIVPLGMPRHTLAGMGSVARFATGSSPCPSTSNNLWYADGRDYCHVNAWTIRNVPVTVGTKMRCLDVTGYNGVVIAVTDDGRYVVEVTSKYGTCHAYFLDQSLRDPSGDLWSIVPEPVETKVFRNIYADGTVGTTAHKSFEVCRENTKYGKVAIGILTQTLAGDKVVSAKIEERTPQLRRPGGVVKNAFA